MYALADCILQFTESYATFFGAAEACVFLFEYLKTHVSLDKYEMRSEDDWVKHRNDIISSFDRDWSAFLRVGSDIILAALIKS